MILSSGLVLDISDVAEDIDGNFFATGCDHAVRRAVEAASLPEVVDVNRLRIGAPIGRPGAVICIGMNYSAHAAESGSPPPEMPVAFFKAPNTVVGPCDEVAIPRGSTKTDWEVELGVVIGKRALYLKSPAQAMDNVAGFVLVNDLSERAFQFETSGGQWSIGKSSPGFCPTGPWLVSPDEIDHTTLGLRSWVNGEVRQNSNTSDMLFSIETVVHHLSQHMALDPGDLILTGSPQGIGLSGKFPYLRSGDVVELEIDGLGRQRQSLVSDELHQS